MEKLQDCLNKYSSGEQQGVQVEQIAGEIIKGLEEIKTKKLPRDKKRRNEAASFLEGYTSKLSQLLGRAPEPMNNVVSSTTPSLNENPTMVGMVAEADGLFQVTARLPRAKNPAHASRSKAGQSASTESSTPSSYRP